MICNKCDEPVTDGAECSICNGCLHYGCAGVAETTYRKMGAEKKAAWRCISCRLVAPAAAVAPACAVGGAPSSAGAGAVSIQSESISDVLKELRDFRGEFTGLKIDFKKDLREVFSVIESLNSKWSDMESRFSNIEDCLIAVESKMQSVSKLQSELKLANDTIATQQNENNLRDQFSRINNLEISGVPYVKN